MCVYVYMTEFFLFRISSNYSLNIIHANNCAYSTHKCIHSTGEPVDHYDQECPRSYYIDKIKQYTSNTVLPTNEVATVLTDVGEMNRVCSSFRPTTTTNTTSTSNNKSDSGSKTLPVLLYKEQDWWKDENKFPIKGPLVL